MFKKMCSNGLMLKDAINNRSICMLNIRFSHDRPPNDENDGKQTAAASQSTTDAMIPSPPTNCCMSGCANCVWIQYAEEISSQLRDGSDVAREIIMKEVQDTNMRSFLEMELRMLKTKGNK